MPVVQTTSLDAMGSEASWRFEIELKFIMVLGLLKRASSVKSLDWACTEWNRGGVHKTAENHITFEHSSWPSPSSP